MLGACRTESCILEMTVIDWTIRRKGQLLFWDFMLWSLAAWSGIIIMYSHCSVRCRWCNPNHGQCGTLHLVCVNAQGIGNTYSFFNKNSLIADHNYSHLSGEETDTTMVEKHVYIYRSVCEGAALSDWPGG